MHDTSLCLLQLSGIAGLYSIVVFLCSLGHVLGSDNPCKVKAGAFTVKGERQP